MSPLPPLFQSSAQNKCFIGHTYNTDWRDTLEAVCDDLLPKYSLQPWYAYKYLDPTSTLREKVVEMIAHARYGIYDLSYWRKDDNSLWEMPRNVLIELGIAIALNRPALLLRHKDNCIYKIDLPDTLKSVQTCEFGGGEYTLRKVLEAQLPNWVTRSPEQDWRNRYCLFGKLTCPHRELYPLLRILPGGKLFCHIADGPDSDKEDFRATIEDILGHFNNVAFEYLDKCATPKGYMFLLCAYCQHVRSTQFAIYRMTPYTSANTFIALGISIGLEYQFGYKIPKIMVTKDLQYIPSLLQGYGSVVTKSTYKLKSALSPFIQQVIEKINQTTYKPELLPFEVFIPQKENTLTREVELELRGSDSDSTSVDELSQTEAFDFFISYHNKDKEWANWIGWQLEQAQYKVVNRPLKPNTNIEEILASDSRLASKGLLLLSPDYVLRFEREGSNLTKVSQNDSFPATNSLVAVQVRQDRRKSNIFVTNSGPAVSLVGLDEERAIEILFSTLKLRNFPTPSLSNLQPSFPGIPRGAGKKKPTSIFYCYSHKDERYRQELERQLAIFKRQGLISEWHDRSIALGTEWNSEIDQHLNTADIILLLISADFIASDYCFGREIQRAMERDERGEARVIPILLRPVVWEGTPFGKIQALPNNEKPIAVWRNRDDAFRDVAIGIHKAIEELQAKSSY